MQKHYGKDFAKVARVQNFEGKLMNHLDNQSYYRQKLPKLFTGEDNDTKNEIKRSVEENLTTVSLPNQIRRLEIYEKRLQAVTSRHTSPKKNRSPERDLGDPLEDSLYVRRLKKANYGRWYIKPDEFSKRVDWFNE
jgi:hypothetical protein